MADAQSARPAGLPLDLLPDTLAVCRLEAGTPLPVWALADDSPFTTISRTLDELSVTAPQSRVPADVRCERDWRVLRVRGPLPLDLVGILASIAAPLAEAGIAIFPIATFDTDYVLVKARDLDRAVAALERAGHRVRRLDSGP